MKLVALSACTSGQFSQSQLCPYNYTVCNDSGLGALDNITYLCLCQSGYLVTGNISSQYFYSELCVAPTSPPSNSTSASPALGIVSITTAPDEELQPMVIALFGVVIGLGLLAIGFVALNVVLILKTPCEKPNAKAEGENGSELADAQRPPIAQASPLGTALLGRPNTLELVFSLRGEATDLYSEPEDYTSSAVTEVPVNPRSMLSVTTAEGNFIEDNIRVNTALAIQIPRPVPEQSLSNVHSLAMDPSQDFTFAWIFLS